MPSGGNDNPEDICQLQATTYTRRRNEAARIFDKLVVIARPYGTQAQTVDPCGEVVRTKGHHICRNWDEQPQWRRRRPRTVRGNPQRDATSGTPKRECQTERIVDSTNGLAGTPETTVHKLKADHATSRQPYARNMPEHITVQDPKEREHTNTHTCTAGMASTCTCRSRFNTPRSWHGAHTSPSTLRDKG